MSDAATLPPVVVPCTDAPSQTVNITLNNQACLINIYAKSINMPFWQPGMIVTDPPTYQNVNPVFVDLYVNDALIIGGVIARNNKQIVRNSYLGFIGDIAFTDLQGSSDPYGVPVTLPPYYLRNQYQLNVPLKFNGKAPPNIGGTCPGLGTRFVLVYWPNLP